MLALVTGCLPDSVLSPRASPPGFLEEQVSYDTAFTYQGFVLGPLHVTHFRRTPLVEGAQVTRLEVENADGPDAKISCLLHAERHHVRRICAVESGGTTSIAVLAGAVTAPLAGYVRGEAALKVTGLSQGSTALGTYTPALEIRRNEGELLGAIVSMGPWTKLRANPRAERRERLWLRLLTLIQATHTDPRDADADTMNGDGTVRADPPPPGDAYDLRPREQGDGTANADHLASLGHLASKLDERGDDDAARQLRRLRMLERDHVFDEEEGAYNERGAVRGVVVQISGGTVWAADPNGRPSNVGIDGGHFSFGGGLRLWERTSVEIGAGLQFPAFSFASAGAKYDAPAGSYMSAAFHFDWTLRHGFEPIVGGLEPVIGLSLQARMAFLEYLHPTAVNSETGDTVGGVHVGLGVEPIVGLQWAFPVNQVGSRVVAFFEVHPEVMFWPLRSASDHSDGEAVEAPAVIQFFESIGEDPTWQVGTSLGLRLEL